MDTIFSGVQPTGSIHLGNYLGAIKNFVNLQNNNSTAKSYYCVVDLHAITVWQPPEELKKDILNTAATFIAAGINPEKSIIFNQSKVSSHSELSWILNCVCRIGWLNRMTQFKEKAGKNKENVSVGLLTYPVLMAADILAYKSNLVPVGEDQKQHLELARDLAQKFNHDYKTKFFPEIKPLISGQATRIMSLRDGRNKMSKSDISDFSRINLLDSKDLIAKKIRKAKTDNQPLMGEEAIDQNGFFYQDQRMERPEATNLMQIYSAIADKNLSLVLREYAGKNFSAFKQDLSEIIIEKICPLGNEIKKLLDDTSYLESILQNGSEKAFKTSSKTLLDLRKIIGLF